MKRWVFLSSLLLMVTALAQAQITIPFPPLPICVEGAVGRGLLTSGNPELPRRIEFAFDVYRYEFPWLPYERIEGRFYLLAWDESGTTIEVRTRRIEELTVEFDPERGGIATFGGPGYAIIRRPFGTPIGREGYVDVVAVDGPPSPCIECPTDRLTVTFTPIDGTPPITFSGYVIPRTGDIRVFRRCR